MRIQLSLLLGCTLVNMPASDGVTLFLFPGPGFTGAGHARQVASVDEIWNASPFPDRIAFSAIWQGTITPRFAEPYTLVVKTRGRFRLLLDGEQVLVGNSESSATSRVSLGVPTTDPRAFRLEYSDWDGVGACSLLWCSRQEGTKEVPIPAAQIAPLTRIVATLPASSAVSPACIPFEHPRMGVVSAQGAGVGSVQSIDPFSCWADVPLKVGTTPVSLALVGGGGVQGSIIWTPTVVGDGRSLTIRRGDSLLLAVNTVGSLLLHRPDGRTIAIPSNPGSPFAQTFPQTGTWLIESLDPEGTALGRLEVQVAGIALPERMACEVNFKRTIRSPAYPATGLQVAVAQPLLGSTGTVSATAGGRCSYYLKPTALGEQSLVYRLPSGSILANCPVDAFTIGSNLYTGNYVYVRDESGYGHGTFQVKMAPRLDYQTITVDFFVPTVRIDGLSKLTFPGMDLAPDGTWTRAFVVSPRQSKSCHRIIVTQDMPDLLPVPPAAIARRVSEVVGIGSQP